MKQSPDPASRVPEVVIVGLGPAGVDLLTSAAVDALASAPARFVRTMRHPAASAVTAPVSCDDLYQSADRIESVYAAIVERVVAGAIEHGSVAYAVPGSPVVAEHTVELLLADERVSCTVVPALSFLDLAWVRLGVDPFAAGARIVDGHRFAIDAAGERGPLLVGQCDSLDVLSDIKLSVVDAPDAAVVVLQGLGTSDERIFEVAWDDLDRVVVPDHLTSLWITQMGPSVGSEVVRFAELVRQLREGCPWDAEQTHQSLTRYLLEETYEVLEAIDRLDASSTTGSSTNGSSTNGSSIIDPDPIDEFCEELGDLLFQVVFHATIASESGWFDLADVARGVHDKLYARHPHVFGDVEIDSIEELRTMWEANKRTEKQRSSIMDGIPIALPSLARAMKVQRKQSSAGIEVPTEALGEPGDPGVRLWALVDELVAEGIDPEDALRQTVDRFVAAFSALESPLD